MSKAYDSVHIPRLVQAMHRIKIPNHITQLITNIFDNRSNHVITPFGPTDNYPVQDGIDQGDTISPVLWRIFYDPLITKLDQSGLGYSLQTSSCPDIKDKSIVTTCTTTCTAFMDDTTLISNNSNNMQQICDISNTFFELNDIQINTDKLHLIVINKKDHQTQINIQQHNITALPSSQAIRVLGVWHNGKGDKNYQTELIHQKTNCTKNIIQRKMITDKQLQYIINQVYIPCITYLLNDMVLAQTTCNQITSKLG